MNIQSIRLENWKKFTDPIEIELKEGLNVIYGPNEGGKSTLIDSIITTFYFKHNSRADDIKSLRPWGTSLQPQASITFQKNRQKYRITKAFQEKKSLLEKMEPNGWQKIAKSDLADQELIKLIGGQLKSRNDSNPESWGLGPTLWMAQGDPTIDKNLNDETLSSLQTLVGATIESKKERKILSNLKSHYLNIYTNKTKKLKEKSVLFQVRKEINSLNKELSLIEQNENKKEELIQNIKDNKFILNKNQSLLKEISEEKDKLAQEAEEAKKHQKNREKLEHEIQGIKTEYKSINEKIDELRENEAEIVKIKLDNDKINLQIVPLQDELTKLNQEIAEKVTELREANNKIDEAIAEKDIAGIAHTTVMDEQTLETMQNNLKEVNQLYDELQLSQDEYNAIIAPSSSQMEKIERLNHDIHDTQTRLHAMGLIVNATAQHQMSGDIYLDDEMVPFSLEEDGNISWTANQSLKIKIDEVGEIEVKSGSQDVKGMKKKLEEMQSDYQNLVAPFGTQDPADMNRLIIKKESSEKELKRIKTELEKKSDKSKDELQSDVLALENKIKSNWSRIPSESQYKGCEGKEKSLVRSELSDKIIQLQDRIGSLTQDRKDLEEELKANRKKVQEFEAAINDFKKNAYGKLQRTEEIKKRLNRLKNEDFTTEEMERKIKQLSFEIDQKTRAWEVYQEGIEEKEKQPLDDFKGLNNKMERINQDIKSQELKNAGMESRLQMIISQYTDSNAIEERYAQLQIKEKQLKTEADALKLLSDLTSFYQENTIRELSEPIRKRVNEDLEKLLGPKYSLNLKEMKPGSIHVNGVNGEEPLIKLLSFGTQEQIWCLFRLALGNILSSQDKQMVVLDDPLVNTDPARMHHALRILEENAKEMQIIVLTCDVDKYNSLTDANFISMDKSL